MDYDDYNDSDANVKPALPVPPVSPVRKNGGTPAPGPGHSAQRMQAWDKQRERQLGMNWKKNLKAEVLQIAADEANEKLAASKSRYSVAVLRDGSGVALVLSEKGTPAPVARSERILPAEINKESASRLIAEFCRGNGIYI